MATNTILPDAPTTVSAKNPTLAATSWPHVVLGVIGAALSGFAVHIHYLAKAGADTGCGFTETINCEVVMSSKYGEMFHIPLGYYGMLFFAVIVLTAIAGKDTKTTALQMARQNMVLATIGFCTSLVLTFISVHFIHAECPVCLSIHSVTLVLFLVSLRAQFRARAAMRAGS